MAGVVEPQEGLAPLIAERFKRQRLAAGHVRAEARQEDDTWPLALASVVGDSRAVRTIKKFGRRGGWLVGHEAGRSKAGRMKAA